METGKRTIIKALIWNAMGLVTMVTVGYIATGSILIGGGIAVANTLIGLLMYIFYERIWGRVRWGLHVK